MISIKSDREIKFMREAGYLNFLTHEEIKKHIKVGVTTKELDKIAYNFISSHNAKPSFLNYDGFPASICTSINDVVVHGIPSNRKIKNGDIVSIDVGVELHGYHSDAARTYIVGDVSKEVQDLVVNTEKALYQGLQQIKEGAKIGDIGAAIEEYAHEHGLSVVEELVGHGVGTNIHEDPDVPNYGKKGTGVTLKAGMVLAVEPMLNLGERYIYLHDDNWTISTDDEMPSAHFEHTVVVTKDGYKILTGDISDGEKI
ncbi:MAG: type I methionyl aminopeptidase [Firmicutes bacterium]|nr:type I methionyl aminopeptidase [Bacillota bacterium]